MRLKRGTKIKRSLAEIQVESEASMPEPINKRKPIKLKDNGTMKVCAMCDCPFFKKSVDNKSQACALCGTVYRMSDGVQIGYIKGSEAEKFIKK